MGKDLSALYDDLVNEGRLTPDPAQRAVLPHLQTIRAFLEAPPPKRGLTALFAKPPAPPKGLYLWGGVGVGKSMLMDLFTEACDCPRRRVHFHAFMQEIHRGMHEVRKTGVDDALKPVAAKVSAELRLLAFDEMQITDITDAMIVGRLFQLLIEDGVVIVTTSNRPPDDLYKNGLNRGLFLPFIAYLKDHMEVVHLASPTDYRRGKLAGSQTYFHPADAEARAAVDRLWTELTGGPGSPLTLLVNGREVVLETYRDGVARASFYDLCGRPLGPADYLAIAAAVRVLIVENIPELAEHNFNLARRFVTLIDALYEAKVRLIATAAEAPERLYILGEGSFEFARTVSRLHEMQAEGWGR